MRRLNSSDHFGCRHRRRCRRQLLVRASLRAGRHARRGRAVAAGQGRAEDSLLPQSDGAARHLAGAEEGLHGDGLHPRLCGRAGRPNTVKVSLDKIQRIGVRTEKVEARVHRPHRARRSARSSTTSRCLTIVTCARTATSRSCSSTRPASTSTRASRCSASTARKFSWRRPTSSSPCARKARWSEPEADRSSKAPCSACAISASRRAASTRCARPMTNPRTIDWPAPATGDVIEKKVINGQRVMAGDELLPHRRPFARLGDRRRRRSRYRRDQGRHAAPP